MDKLSKNVEKRSRVRAGITKLIKKVQALDFETESPEFVSELLEILEIKSKSLKDFDLEIEDLISDWTKFKLEIAQSEEYEEKIFLAKIKLKNKIKEIKKDNGKTSKHPVLQNTISRHLNCQN